MKYLSLFSGIEAATVAWEPLGFKAVGFSEIDEFACELLTQKYPSVKNYGDITKIDCNQILDEHGTVDIIVGGSPCQGFSQAGRRLGLEDVRSRLALEYIRVISEIRPKYVVWENVPNVRTINEGRDFKQFLQAIIDLGYGLCWRVLDAQYFGVPQRRKRMFVVGVNGDSYQRQTAREILCETSNGSPDITQLGLYGGNCYVEQEVSYAGRKTSQDEKIDFIDPFLGATTGISPTITRTGAHKNSITNHGGVLRFMTADEWDMLNGFPKGYTDIVFKGKQASERERMEAQGNSMVVPVMQWIGQRIKQYEERANE